MKTVKSLLEIASLQRHEIERILEHAEAFLGRPSPDTLRGSAVINMFFEASTRTRISFEMAARRLGAHVTNLQADGSSMSKGESLVDTCQTLNAMRPDILIIRHPSSGAPALIDEHVDCAVINAGDGTHEHPTQALLDALTLKRHLGKLEGLKVAICGDVLHSRVARSNILLLQKFGAELRMVGPSALLPERTWAHSSHVFENVSFTSDVQEAVTGVDAIMVLRLQKERMSSSLVPSFADYARRYQIRAKHLRLAAPHAVVMHPGPVNRGVEVEAALVDDPRSVILDQVQHGVVVRMAALVFASQRNSDSPAI